MFQNLIDILASPYSVFARLRETPTVLAPLLLMLVSMVSVQAGYFMMVDYSFIVEQAVDQAMARNPNQDASQLREQLANISPMLLVIPGLVAVTLVILATTLLYAAYLNFISKFGLQDYRYKHWLSLMSWTSIPVIFVALSSWAVLLSSSNGQVTQQDMQVLSIDNLLALNSNSSLLQSLTLPQLWSLLLLVLGYQHFTGKSMLKSALIALAPMLIIYGIWALISLL